MLFVYIPHSSSSWLAAVAEPFLQVDENQSKIALQRRRKADVKFQFSELSYWFHIISTDTSSKGNNNYMNMSIIMIMIMRPHHTEDGIFDPIWCFLLCFYVIPCLYKHQHIRDYYSLRCCYPFHVQTSTDSG